MKKKNSYHIDFDEKSRFWIDKAVGQFGATTNLFFVISAGFLAYLIERNCIEHTIRNLNQSANAVYALSILFSLFSVVLGILCVMSRLYDLRLTRHKVWIRKKTFQRHGKTLKDNHLNIEGYSFLYRFKNFYSSVFNKYYIIDDNDIEDFKALKEKFSKLRIRILLLGRFSWNCLIIQLFLIIGSFISFVTSLFMA